MNNKLRLAMIARTDDSNQLDPSLARGLSDADCEVHLIQPDVPACTVARRAIRRFAPEFGFPEFNQRILREIKAVCPDVFWMFKGMEIYPSTLDALRALGVTLVNYNADHPFEYLGPGSGNANVRRGVTKYHLYLTYSRPIRQEMLERYPDLDVGVVPFGHDVSESIFDRIKDESEILRVCFLGTPDDHRARELGVLLDAGLPVDVFGSRWDRFLGSAPNLTIHGPAIGEDMYRTLRRYRVQMNFFRPHNAGSHNMRSFEAPACGAIMLAEDSIEHREFFENGREAFYFCSRREMIDLARALLAMPKSEAEDIRSGARRRSVNSGYWYRDRAHAALKLIEVGHHRRQEKDGRVA